MAREDPVSDVELTIKQMVADALYRAWRAGDGGTEREDFDRLADSAVDAVRLAVGVIRDALGVAASSQAMYEMYLDETRREPTEEQTTRARGLIRGVLDNSAWPTPEDDSRLSGPPR